MPRRFCWQKVYPRFIHRCSGISITAWFTNVWKLTLFIDLYAYFITPECNHLAGLIAWVIIVTGTVPRCLWRPNLESCQEFEWSIFLTLCLRCWRQYSVIAAACCIVLGMLCYSSSFLMIVVSADCFVVYQFHIHQQRFSVRTGCTGCCAGRYMDRL